MSEEEAQKVLESYRHARQTQTRQEHTQALKDTIDYQNRRWAELATLLECDTQHVLPAIQLTQTALAERTSEVYDLKEERKKSCSHSQAEQAG